MASSLGWSAAASCSAARAGISRTVACEDVMMMDNAAGEAVPIAVHAASPITDGFEGGARLFRLAGAALDDLDRTSDQLPDPGAVLLVCPDGYWEEQGARAEWTDLLDDVLPAVEAQRRDRLAPLTQRVAARLGSEVDATFEPGGFFRATERAGTWLSSRAATHCLLGSVDSLIDSPTVHALSLLGLLKSPENPVGFVPGELAVFLRLESASAAHARGATVLASLHAPVVDGDGTHRLSEAPPQGEALARVAHECMSRVGGEPGVVLGSINGDPWRALDWGYATCRIDVRTRQLPQLHPAEAFGEVGAAAPAAAVAMAIHRLMRQGRAEDALVLASGDSGTRGALYVRYAGDGGGP